MISFLGLGEDGLSEARKAIEWVAERVGLGQGVKGLVCLDEGDVDAPIRGPCLAISGVFRCRFL